MKPLLSLSFLSLSLCLSPLLVSCGGASQSDPTVADAPHATAVTLTHARVGHLARVLTLSATTTYTRKSVVTSPIAAYVTACHVAPGSRVSTGEELYRLESKEQHALGDEGMGVQIPVRAGRGGIVSDVLQQAGGYVTEGTTLCTIADAGSLAFEIQLPYEYRRIVRPGVRCELILPDETHLRATVDRPLVGMNTAAQAERMLARAAGAPFLPEGMRVEARFDMAPLQPGKMLILPRDAVQSDEALTEHWIMKLDGKGRPVKVPVTVGQHTATEIEVQAAGLTTADRVILTGAYGLEEGSAIIIRQTK